MAVLGLPNTRRSIEACSEREGESLISTLPGVWHWVVEPPKDMQIDWVGSTAAGALAIAVGWVGAGSAAAVGAVAITAPATAANSGIT
jgi:hypothetical protein